jgi:DNA-binding transcriptional LysR family regulator
MPATELIERLPRHLKLGELRVFVAVLEHRSFRKAAAALHITQPAVTKTIANLEGLLGARLFDRNAHGVEPTIHGLTFAPHAIAIFGELRSAAQEMGIVSSGAKGTLRIGTVPTPAIGFLPMAIRRLVDVHPEVFVSLMEARETELVERLRKRDIELAVVRLALFTPGEDVQVTPLFEERLCVLASKDHPLAGRKRLVWSDLLAHRWVMPSADSYFFDHVRRTLTNLELEMPRHAVESKSIHTQYAMVLYGGMLSFGLRSEISFAPDKNLLVRLPVELPSITGAIGILNLLAREQSPLALQLIGHIRELTLAR